MGGRKDTKKTDVVIAGATRTPIGSFLGALSGQSSRELGSLVIRNALKRAKVDPKDVDDVVMGQVITAGCGQNPARQSAIDAEIPKEKTAMTVNQVCGSGLRAVALAAQSLTLEDAEIAVAGGQESMSLSPHAAHVRRGQRMGDLRSVDTMIRDGLWCAFNDYHMGVTAENVARQWQVRREDQDQFAVHSQNKAEAAQKAGKFDDEITPVAVLRNRQVTMIKDDEYPRHGAKVEDIAKLRAVFDKEGTVTAGNASGLNDGAAALVLMRRGNADKRGIEPLATVRSWATAGVDPAVMGTGPIPASRKALERAGWKVEDLDLIEANEAFAAQACVVNQEMGWDADKVNVNGGAIALGHPIGASGARILVTLLYEMQRRDAKKGLATLCIGGGMGIALCVERG